MTPVIRELLSFVNGRSEPFLFLTGFAVTYFPFPACRKTNAARGASPRNSRVQGAAGGLRFGDVDGAER